MQAKKKWKVKKSFLSFLGVVRCWGLCKASFLSTRLGVCMQKGMRKSFYSSELKRNSDGDEKREKRKVGLIIKHRIQQPAT